MKKILIVSTVSRQFYLFEQGNIEVLKGLGYEVHGAANFEDQNERLDALDIVRHPFDIQRSPFSLKNFKAYKQLKMIMKSENFDLVHCHSPMGGVLTRLAAKSIGLKNIIYTAHGFHFYKGAPILNWLVYYPVEYFLSRITKILITINDEDYNRARKFKAKYLFKVPGVGIDLENFRSKQQTNISRADLKISDNDTVFVSVGELNVNKNHKVVIEALSKIENNNIKYLICGQGSNLNKLKKIVNERDLSDNVLFLGYRNNIPEFLNISDIFVFPSLREGLSLSLMEAMADGMPVIASKIRGNVDLIDEESGGYLFQPKDAEKLSQIIDLVVKNKRDLIDRMGDYNKLKIKEFSQEKVMKIMKEIYEI